MLFHYAHNTGGSIYPFLISLNIMSFLSVILSWFLGFYFSVSFLYFIMPIFVFFVWTKDSMFEGIVGCHTLFIQFGLKLSFFLFLFTEFMFFFSVFWFYFDTALTPNIELGAVWPSFGVWAPDFMGFPFLNTLLLISSGISLTWAHSIFLSGGSIAFSMLLTIFLAILFLGVQFYEYFSLSFTLSDNSYGSIFFFGTGFHGFHVLVGTLFLICSFYWLIVGAYSVFSHLSFECAILYWHFVDVVWLFLYLFVYWWGG